MDSRIIELVSSASLDVYPNNTVASFTTLLPENVVLDGEWEVALLEISYPSRCYNVTEGRFFLFPTAMADGTTHFMRGTFSYFIEPGMYESLDEIVEAMNAKSTVKYPMAKIGEKSVSKNGNVRFRFLTESYFEPESDDLKQIFGYHEPQELPASHDWEGTYPLDLSRFHSMMVYTDIIEDEIVGDVKAPLLRCVHIVTRYKNNNIYLTQNVMVKTFDNPQYKRVVKQSFHSINIQLRSPYGELLPFVPIGAARLTLHFRKII